MSQPQRRLFLATTAVACLGATTRSYAAWPLQGLFRSQRPALPTSLVFGGVEYLHRSSQGGQHEFTPQVDGDPGNWRDMLTVNLQDTTLDADQLAAVANRMLGTYQQHGKIVKTVARPRADRQGADHFVCAVLDQPGYVEAVFTRLVLLDGRGCSIVYSHRIYGAKVGPAMSQWLQSRGATAEKTLMAWDALPTPATLKSLLQT